MKVTGSCSCGGVEFELDTANAEFGHCYCRRCRKATGSGRSSVLAAPPNHLKWIKGDEYLRRWDMPTASGFATSFCAQCGSPLPRLTRDGKYAMIPAGSIDSDLDLLPHFHEHLASKANWVELDETDIETYEEGAQI